MVADVQSAYKLTNVLTPVSVCAFFEQAQRSGSDGLAPPLGIRPGMQPGFQVPSGGSRPPQAAVRPLLPAGVRPQEQAGAEHRQSPAGPDSDSQLSQVSWLHQVLLPSWCLCFLARLDFRDVFPRMFRMCVFPAGLCEMLPLQWCFAFAACTCVATCIPVVVHVCARMDYTTLAQPLHDAALIHADR